MNRGGSWNNVARNARSANRNRNDPGNRNNNLGVRPASPSQGPFAGVGRLAGDSRAAQVTARPLVPATLNEARRAASKGGGTGSARRGS